MQFKVIAGPSCAESLLQGVVRKIREMSGDSSFELTLWKDQRFSDGEFLPQIKDNVRGADVYVIQSSNPPEENFKYMKLLLKAAAGASARRLTAVYPYMGGLRQDRKDKPRVPITAQLNAQETENAMRGVAERHVMILQPHFPQIQSVFEVSSDMLYPTDSFSRCVREVVGSEISRVVPVATDIGAGEIVGAYAKRLRLDYAVGDKHRDPKTGKVIIRKIHGEVKNKIASIFDDILDTASTLIAVLDKLIEMEAVVAYVFITHGLCSDKCIERLIKAHKSGFLKHVFITDSIKHPDGFQLPEFVTVVPIGELIGEAIYRNYTDDSISEIDGLFSYKS